MTSTFAARSFVGGGVEGGRGRGCGLLAGAGERGRLLLFDGCFVGRDDGAGRSRSRPPAAGPGFPKPAQDYFLVGTKSKS